MPQSFKVRCLKAIDILIEEYNQNKHFACKSSCSLCTIYYPEGIFPKDCPGCPNTAFIARRDRDLNRGIISCFLRSLSPRGRMNKYEAALHAEFWKEAKEHLKTLDPDCFQPSKSKPYHFEDLLKIDLKVYR